MQFNNNTVIIKIIRFMIINDKKQKIKKINFVIIEKENKFNYIYIRKINKIIQTTTCDSSKIDIEFR